MIRHINSKLALVEARPQDKRFQGETRYSHTTSSRRLSLPVFLLLERAAWPGDLEHQDPKEEAGDMPLARLACPRYRLWFKLDSDCQVHLGGSMLIAQQWASPVAPRTIHIKQLASQTALKAAKPNSRHATVLTRSPSWYCECSCCTSTHTVPHHGVRCTVHWAATRRWAQDTEWCEPLCHCCCGILPSRYRYPTPRRTMPEHMSHCMWTITSPEVANGCS